MYIVECVCPSFFNPTKLLKRRCVAVASTLPGFARECRLACPLSSVHVCLTCHRYSPSSIDVTLAAYAALTDGQTPSGQSQPTVESNRA